MTRLEKFIYVKNQLGWQAQKNGDIINSLGKSIGYKTKNGYIDCCFVIDKKRFHIYAHQFVYWFFTNEVVLCLDHINQIKTDNSFDNLRSVTHQQNKFNNNRKGYYKPKGRRKYTAYIDKDGKRIHLGTFEYETDARNAYIEAKKIYHKI